MIRDETGAYRYTRWLRYLAVRRLCCPCEWRGCKKVVPCWRLRPMAAMYILTIEGLSEGEDLHPMQAAFPGQSRPAVRFLHAGHDHERGGPGPAQPEPDRGGNPQGLWKATSAAAPATTTSSRRSRKAPLACAANPTPETDSHERQRSRHRRARTAARRFPLHQRPAASMWTTWSCRARPTPPSCARRTPTPPSIASTAALRRRCRVWSKF